MGKFSSYFHQCAVLIDYLNNLFKIERKLCKVTKQLLLTYKKSKKYPKGMKLRFCFFVTLITSSKLFVAKYFTKRQLVHLMKSLKLLRKKLELLEPNVTIIVIISKIKLQEKIINLLGK